MQMIQPAPVEFSGV